MLRLMIEWHYFLSVSGSWETLHLPERCSEKCYRKTSFELAMRSTRSPLGRMVTNMMHRKSFQPRRRVFNTHSQLESGQTMPITIVGKCPCKQFHTHSVEQIVNTEYALQISMLKSGRNGYHLSSTVSLPISLPAINKKQLCSLLKGIAVFSQDFQREGKWDAFMSSKEEIWRRRTVLFSYVISSKIRFEVTRVMLTMLHKNVRHLNTISYLLPYWKEYSQHLSITETYWVA